MCNKIQVFIEDGFVTSVCSSVPGTSVEIIEYVDEYDIADGRLLIDNDGDFVDVVTTKSEEITPLHTESVVYAAEQFLITHVRNQLLVRALMSNNKALIATQAFVSCTRKRGKTPQELEEFTLDLIKMAVTLIENNKEAT